MAQFDVYRNQDLQSKERIPYLLDIQNNLFKGLSTRLVVPLVAKSEVLHRLNFEIIVRNQKYVVSTQEVSAVSMELLKDKVFSLKDKSNEILEAMNFLLMGFDITT
jgi:toxin CcdB